MIDTRFSSAIHALIMIAETDEILTSQHIAHSVGTNASYIRKILALLKRGGLIQTQQGVKGIVLQKQARDITLLDIYFAINPDQSVQVFDIHQNPNDACIVGHYIKPVLKQSFNKIDQTTQEELKSQTLQDLIHMMKVSKGKTILEIK